MKIADTEKVEKKRATQMTTFKQTASAASEYAYEVADAQEIEVSVAVKPKTETIRIQFAGCESVIWYDEQCWSVIVDEQVYNYETMEECFDVATDNL